MIIRQFLLFLQCQIYNWLDFSIFFSFKYCPKYWQKAVYSFIFVTLAREIHTVGKMLQRVQHLRSLHLLCLLQGHDDLLQLQRFVAAFPKTLSAFIYYLKLAINPFHKCIESK